MVDPGLRNPEPHEEYEPSSVEGPGKTRHQAFISYSHAADARTAPALRQGLHRLAKPLMRTRAMRVFLDEASLSANPGLWSTITDELAGSEFFILLASPQAAASEWVRREVAWWRAHKPARHLLIGLTEGAIAWDPGIGDFDWQRTTALPPDVRGMFAEEPLHVDLRWTRDSDRLPLADPRFRNDVADFAAFISGRDKDELLGEDVRQHRRLLRLGWTAIVSLSVLLVAAVAFGRVAVVNGNRARAEARLALSRQLAAQSTALRDERLDRSLLLAIEAVNTQPTEEAQASLLAALGDNSELVYSNQVPDHDNRSLAFDSQHRRLAWGSAEGVVVWDLDRRMSQTLPGLAGVRAVAVNPGGVIAASGKDTTMWSAGGLEPMGPALAASGRLSFNRDGTVLAVMGESTTTFWDVGSGQRRGPPMTVPRRDGGESCPYRSVIAISPDLRRMAFSDTCNEIVLWDVERRRAVGERLTDPNTAPISDLVFSPDGKTLASASGRQQSAEGLGGSVRLWDVERASLRSEPVVDDGHFGPSFFDLAFSRDGRLLAVGETILRSPKAVDGVITLIDVEAGRARDKLLRSDSDIIGGLAFGAGRTLASVASSSVNLWEVDREDRQGQTLLTLSETNRSIDRVALSPDGAFLAADTVTSGKEGAQTSKEGATREVTVWNLRDSRPVGSPLPGGDFLALSPDGRRVAVGGAGEGVSAPLVVWDVASRQQVGQPVVDAVGAAFSPDGRTMAVGREDGTTTLWDLEAAREIGVLAARPVPESSASDAPDLGNRWLSFGRDGRTLSVARADGLITRWSLDDDRHLVSEFRTTEDGGFSLPISEVAFSPDGTLAVVATFGFGDLTADGSVAVWDVGRRRELARRDGAVSRVAFAPDGKRFTIVDDFTRSVLVWDVARLRPVDAPVLRQTDITAVAVGPDGVLVVGSAQGVSLSSIDPAAWRTAACRVFGRSLTRDEWTDLIGSGRPYARTCEL